MRLSGRKIDGRLIIRSCNASEIKQLAWPLAAAIACSLPAVAAHAQIDPSRQAAAVALDAALRDSGTSSDQNECWGAGQACGMPRDVGMAEFTRCARCVRLSAKLRKLGASPPHC